jgi:hypothetical protein
MWAIQRFCQGKWREKRRKRRRACECLAAGGKKERKEGRKEGLRESETLKAMSSAVS